MPRSSLLVSNAEAKGFRQRLGRPVGEVDREQDAPFGQAPETAQPPLLDISRSARPLPLTPTPRETAGLPRRALACSILCSIV
ncbi:hypothetical protein [Streptomyces sp. NK08204]|uniref:hypothetical protein n=1 Tax=Streptomyces sp. NK08204 TaxID=2873260 RepID=UPI001CECA072|nr:hypothetical protein [Streptomyces sp. NK08204]